MAITTSSIRNGNGISYTVITDNSADWNNVANNTYFYNIADSLIYFKNNSGTVYSAYDNSVSRYVSISNANSPYTATTANEIIEVTGSLTGPITINLYSAVNNAGRTLYIKNNSTNNTSTNFVTIDADGSQTIDGQLTRTLGDLEDLFIQSNGVNWIIMNRNAMPLLFQHLGFSPVDATTYYIGNTAGIEPSITEGVTRQVIALSSGWIKTVTMMISVSTNLGSAQNSTFQLRNVTTNTNTNISTTVQHNTASQNNVYTLTTPLQVRKGDFITIVWTTPTWTADPSVVRQVMTALIE